MKFSISMQGLEMLRSESSINWYWIVTILQAFSRIFVQPNSSSMLGRDFRDSSDNRESDEDPTEVVEDSLAVSLLSVSLWLLHLFCRN